MVMGKILIFPLVLPSLLTELPAQVLAEMAKLTDMKIVMPLEMPAVTLVANLILPVLLAALSEVTVMNLISVMASLPTVLIVSSLLLSNAEDKVDFVMLPKLAPELLQLAPLMGLLVTAACADLTLTPVISQTIALATHLIVVLTSKRLLEPSVMICLIVLMLGLRLATLKQFALVLTLIVSEFVEMEFLPIMSNVTPELPDKELAAFPEPVFLSPPLLKLLAELPPVDVTLLNFVMDLWPLVPLILTMTVPFALIMIAMVTEFVTWTLVPVSILANVLKAGMALIATFPYATS